MRYSASAHTRFYHRFHVVWVTKYRYQTLQGPMRERIREIIMQTCNKMDVHIVKGVLVRDQVHMFLSIPPKLSLSDVLHRIKGRSSHRIQIGVSRTAQTLLEQTVLGTWIVLDNLGQCD